MQQPVAEAVQTPQENFGEEMKRLREIVHAEYELKVRNAFDEIDELKVTLEENAKEK